MELKIDTRLLKVPELYWAGGMYRSATDSEVVTTEHKLNVSIADLTKLGFKKQ